MEKRRYRLKITRKGFGGLPEDSVVECDNYADLIPGAFSYDLDNVSHFIPWSEMLILEIERLEEEICKEPQK